jgi:hypothetical protein
MLALFLLWSPVIALALFNRSNKPLKFLCVLLIGITSLLWTFNNTIRPITVNAVYSSKSREENYFARRPEFYPLYIQVSNKIVSTNCQKLGLNFYGDTWEYPLWVLLKNRGFDGVIEHIDVNNPSNKFEDKSFDPCLVLSVGRLNSFEKIYSSITMGRFVLYMK